VNLSYYIFFKELEQISIAEDAKRLTKFKSRCAARSSNLSAAIKRFTASKFGSENSVSAHALRRYYANNLYEKGMEATNLAVFMRHQSTKTSIRYVGTKRLLKSAHKDLITHRNEEKNKE
jgi:integrase